MTGIDCKEKIPKCEKYRSRVELHNEKGGEEKGSTLQKMPRILGRWFSCFKSDFLRAFFALFTLFRILQPLAKILIWYKNLTLLKKKNMKILQNVTVKLWWKTEKYPKRGNETQIFKHFTGFYIETFLFQQCSIVRSRLNKLLKESLPQKKLLTGN